jgi:competence protein ComEA
VSASAGGEASRVAALLALLALGDVVRPVPEPVRCTTPRLAGDPEAKLASVRCEGGDAPGLGAGSAVGLLFGRRLDPNRADASALEALPGVGPTRARELVRAARARPFCSLADIERVPGIGPRTRARLAPWLAPECGPP